MKKVFIVILIIIIGLFLIDFIGYVIKSSYKENKELGGSWEIESLDLPIIIRKNCIVVGGPSWEPEDPLPSRVERDVFLEMRVANFRIYYPKTKNIVHEIDLQMWEKQGNLKLYVARPEESNPFKMSTVKFIEGRVDIWLRMEVGKYEGEIHIQLINNDGILIGEGKAFVEVNIEKGVLEILEEEFNITGS
ncbi:MAG: hypothetical protein PHH35_01365 [Candidatus Pacebacteria bacterium]|jgi:hypothetical protein|nr:hypothetical protein [Candidatus Paceibacterota bacterium]